ncbi:MAG: hypothetical protein HGA76_09665 [Candidatus Firestonebacteria bacterium]|nr:hypothetical protein [Candidatus Firestonebacteria bacterium]
MILSLSAPGWAAFNLTVVPKNISDNMTAAQVSWSSVTPTWKEADQYLAINYFSDQVGWGVQIYTDNHNAGANPRYTGSTSSGDEGAGLVGNTNTALYAPMGWTAQADTATARPSILSDGAGVLISGKGYAYFKDKMQTAGLYPFVSGEDYITLVNSFGLATNKPTWRVAAFSPIYVYLIANFMGKPNQAYGTNQLTVELYHQ